MPGMRALRVGGLLLAGLILLPGGAAAQETPPPLRVCLLAHNTPYAERASGAGFDIDTARRVAASLGRTFEPVWTANADTITEIDESEYPLGRLRGGSCDAIFSLAGPASTTLRQYPELALGRPYYGAGFALVSCGGAPAANLAALSGRRIAVQSQTVAQFALLAIGADTGNYFSTVDAIEAARTGAADAAMLWGPAAGHALADGTRPECRVTDLEPPRALRWNHHVGTRADDGGLRDAIDTALAELAANGEMTALMQRHGIPQFPPFATTYSASAIEELRQALPPPRAP